MLEGVEAVDWVSLPGAYGPTGEVPMMLRDMASEDEDVAFEARSWLGEQITHQGLVYPLTTACVPFLAELARVSHHGRAELLEMLGAVADPDRAAGSELPNIRAALARAADDIVPLVEDIDPTVRAKAVYALAQTGAACPIGVLRDRYDADDNSEVRAALLIALGMCDRDHAGPTLTAAMFSSSGPESLAAAVGLIRADLDWPDGAAPVLAELIVNGTTLADSWCGFDRAIDMVMAETRDADVATAALAQAVSLGQTQPSDAVDAREPATGLRSAIFALEQRCSQRRSAPGQLVGLLGPVLRSSGPERRYALSAGLRIGVAVLEYVDVIADIADRHRPAPTPMGVTEDEIALRTLIRLADPRWVAPAVRGVSAGTFRPPSISRPYRPAGPELLYEIRDHLSRAHEPKIVALLADAAGAIGPVAANLEDALRAVLPLAPKRVLWALRGIGRVAADELYDPNLRPDGVQWVIAAHERAGALSELQHLLGPGEDKPTEANVLAAHALLRLGDPGPAAAIVRDALHQRPTRARAATLAADLADASLKDDLRRALVEDGECIEVAVALVRLGEPPHDFATTLRQWLKSLSRVNRETVVARCDQLASSAATEVIRDLATSDRRTIGGGEVTSIIWEDELLQQVLTTIYRPEGFDR